MRRKRQGGTSGGVKLAAVVLMASLISISGASNGRVFDEPDSCELEALRAYQQALKICELAINPNPRLRCFEAARAVYFNTLLECRKGKSEPPD